MGRQFNPVLLQIKTVLKKLTVSSCKKTKTGLNCLPSYQVFPVKTVGFFFFFAVYCGIFKDEGNEENS